MLVAAGVLVEAMDAAKVTRVELAKRIERTPGFVSQVGSNSD